MQHQKAEEPEYDPRGHCHDGGAYRREKLCGFCCIAEGRRLADKQCPYVDSGQTVISARSQGHNSLGGRHNHSQDDQRPACGTTKYHLNPTTLSPFLTPSSEIYPINCLNYSRFAGGFDNEPSPAGCRVLQVIPNPVENVENFHLCAAAKGLDLLQARTRSVRFATFQKRPAASNRSCDSETR